MSENARRAGVTIGLQQMDDGGFSFAPYCATDEEFVGPPALDSKVRGADRHGEIPDALVKLAKRIKAIRESRVALLDPSLFGEPAWNMLLALYIAAGRAICIVDLGPMCRKRRAGHDRDPIDQPAARA